MKLTPGSLFPLTLTGLLALTGLCFLQACASNPIAAAQTVDQKAYAIYGAFVISEEEAAKVALDSSVDVHVRQAIQAADAKAKPSADALMKAYEDYSSAKTLLAAGHGDADTLSIASANLNQWLVTAQTDINSLVAAVKSH